MSWPILLASAQLRVTHVAELSIRVDNLWVLVITCHPHPINPEKKVWVLPLQCENPHLPHTSAFADDPFQGLSAHSLQLGNRKPFNTAWNIPLIFSPAACKVSPPWAIPLHVRVFKTKLRRAKDADHTAATRRWEGTTGKEWQRTPLFFFILTLAGTVLKRGNAIAKTYQAWAASGKSGLGFHPLLCCFRLLPISISQDESVDTLPVCQQDSLGLVGRGWLTVMAPLI